MDSSGTPTWPTPKRRNFYPKNFLYLPEKFFSSEKIFCARLTDHFADSPSSPTKKKFYLKFVMLIIMTQKRKFYLNISFTYLKRSVFQARRNNFSHFPEKISYTCPKKQIFQMKIVSYNYQKKQFSKQRKS